MKRQKKKPARVVRRLSNWPALHARFLAERRVVPHEWGRQDCCLFVCDGILTTTGIDPAAKLFRGKYRDALGAARLLKKQGGVEAIAVKVCAAHGFAEVPVAMAQRADVVLLDVEDEQRSALGWCDGALSAFPGPDGLVWHKTLNCRRAWAIGRVVPQGGPA